MAGRGGDWIFPRSTDAFERAMEASVEDIAEENGMRLCSSDGPPESVRICRGDPTREGAVAAVDGKGNLACVRTRFRASARPVHIGRGGNECGYRLTRHLPGTFRGPARTRAATRCSSRRCRRRALASLCAPPARSPAIRCPQLSRDAAWALARGQFRADARAITQPWIDFQLLPFRPSHLLLLHWQSNKVMNPLLCASG